MLYVTSHSGFIVVLYLHAFFKYGHTKLINQVLLILLVN